MTAPETISTLGQLDADTAMGAVSLNVADLDAMTAYYRDGVGLQVLRAEGARVTLGRGTRDIIVLEQTPELRQASPHDAGLFHTAIVFETKAALAASVYSVARRYPGSFTGSSDHHVSEAFYFNDPENNGVELYWDRDRSLWSWADGAVKMMTVYLDPNKYLEENLSEEGTEHAGFGEAHVGHVHLSVGDVETAKEFYVNQLGWDTTIELPGQALFVSAGKYHHHMAMNVWNSKGAGRRQRTLGLGQIDIVVPGADDLGALHERMSHFGLETRDDGQTLSVNDPWNNLVNLRVG